MESFHQVMLFTDGACSGNPGKGGYGAVLVSPDGQVKELGRGYKETTNNKMEIMAVIEGLKAAKDMKGELWVLTDSTYVIRGITQWIWGWKKRGWKNAEGNPVANQELWEELDKQVYFRKKLGPIEWKYIRGHTGNPGNERCDAIAVGFTQGKWVDLYDGSLLQYDIAIHDLPENMDLPPLSDNRNKEKKKAHSYLSYVNGQLQRHETWKDCEAVVKGRPGAKFKKSTSAANEIEIVESWGLNPNLLK